jgi:hypothetical protein
MAEFNVDLPVIITQLPQLHRAAHAETAHPDTLQFQAALQTQELIKQNRDKVQKVEAEEEAAALHKDGDRRRDPNDRPRHGRTKGGEPDPEPEPASASPWSGNIIDLKV